MDLLNDRVYPKSDVEIWLSERAGMTRSARARKNVLRDATEVVVDGDAYFFEPVSETHCRVHRANASSVKEIHAILNNAPRRRLVHQVIRAVLLAGFAVLGAVAIFEALR